MTCTVSDRALHALVSNALSPAEAAVVRAHAVSCPRCAPVLRDASAAVAALRDREIELPTSLQQMRELAAAKAGRVEEPRARRWLGVALASIALLLFGLLWRMSLSVMPQPDALLPFAQVPPVVRLADGALAEALTLTVDMRVTADATLELGDGSRVTAQRASRFNVREAKRWEVTEGELHFVMQKQNEPFVVATPEVTVTVVGTQFTVERRDGATRVAVQEGLVQVEAGVSTKLLGAGEVWPEEPARPSGVRPKASPFDSAKIRARIAAGKTSEARVLIVASSKSFADSVAVLAELGVLTAEADLAERKYRPALDQYLAVVRDFPATQQAEQALFAAAQLAFDEPAAGYRPERLLRDYLETYPRGRFHHDAQRLLRSLEK